MMIRTAFLEVTAPWCDNYEKEKRTENQIHNCLHLYSRLKLGQRVNLSEQVKFAKACHNLPELFST